jgi:hypothetical protein
MNDKPLSPEDREALRAGLDRWKRCMEDILGSPIDSVRVRMARAEAAVERVKALRAGLCNCVNRNMSRHGPLCPAGKIDAALAGPGIADGRPDPEEKTP